MRYTKNCAIFLAHTVHDVDALISSLWRQDQGWKKNKVCGGKSLWTYKSFAGFNVQRRLEKNFISRQSILPKVFRWVN